MHHTNRTAQIGMTLVEIMIVVIIMALIATGAAVAVLPQLRRARVNQTRTGLEVVRSAAQMYLADNAGRCPTVEQLVQEGFLDRNKKTTDAWDNPYLLRCDEGGEPVVMSRGPDGQEGSEDDIR